MTPMHYACVIDGQRVDDTSRLRALVLEETAGERSPPFIPVTEEVERLVAAELVMKMRRVKMLAPGWSEITRTNYARSFERLSLEAAAASAWLRRVRAIDPDFVPEFLRETGHL